MAFITFTYLVELSAYKCLLILTTVYVLDNVVPSPGLNLIPSGTSNNNEICYYFGGRGIEYMAIKLVDVMNYVEPSVPRNN